MAHPERDVSSGDQISGTERHRMRQPFIHVCHRAGVSVDAMPLQVWDFLVLFGLGSDHVVFRSVSGAGDEERANRGDDGEGVEAALALEEVYGRRPGLWRREEWAWKSVRS